MAALGTPWAATGGLTVSAGTWVVWGANAAGTVGGMAYTTDSGATWTISTSATQTNIRAGVLMNNIIVLVGDNGRFLTGATAAGTFTQRDMAGRLSYYSAAADNSTAVKQLVLLGRNRTVNPVVPAHTKVSRRQSVVTIDASNADPSTWRIASAQPAPLPMTIQVLLETNVYDGSSINQWQFIGQGMAMASTEIWGGSDYYRFKAQKGEPKVNFDQHLTGDAAWRVAV